MSNDVSRDESKMKENIDALVNEAIGSHTVNHALTDPDFKDMIYKYPEAWSKINSVYLAEITKLKHIIVTTHTSFQDLYYENKTLKLELETANEEIGTLEKVQGKDIISFGGIKGRVIDVAKIGGIGVFCILLFIVVCFGLAKIDPESFDKVANVVERMVHKGKQDKAHNTQEGETNGTK